MITITCASIPERAANLVKVAEALVPQCDRFIVYLNGYDAPPEIEGITISGPDLGDAGKFYLCPDEGYHLTVDDDLFYPRDYIETIIAGIERYERRYVVSLHGRTFEGPRARATYYRGHTKLYRCLGAVEMDAPVHFPGTGVMGYHTSLVRFSASDFPYANMADVWVGRRCQMDKVGIVCLGHREGYITHQPIDHENTIAAKMKGRDVIQTRVVNEHLPWQTYAQC